MSGQASNPAVPSDGDAQPSWGADLTIRQKLRSAMTTSIFSDAAVHGDAEDEQENQPPAPSPVETVPLSTHELDVMLANSEEMVTILARLCIERAFDPGRTTILELEKLKLDKSVFIAIVQFLRCSLGHIYPGSNFNSTVFTTPVVSTNGATRPESAVTSFEESKVVPSPMDPEIYQKLIAKIRSFLDRMYITSSPYQTIQQQATPRQAIETLMAPLESNTFVPKVVIHCVRHAQAEHNVPASGADRWNIRDPALTAIGKAQAEKLVDIFPYMSKISIVFCSPMLRTIQTAFLGFSPILFKEQPKMILWPELRECGVGPTSKGSSPAQLHALYSAEQVDISLVTDGWDSDEVPRSVTKTRANLVRKDLLDLTNAMSGLSRGKWKDIQVAFMDQPPLEEIHILLISHGGFLKELLEAAPPDKTTRKSTPLVPNTDEQKQSEEDQKLKKKAPYMHYWNAEYRSYYLTARTGVLVEMEESIDRRDEFRPNS